MATQSVTLHLPDPLYKRLKRRAEQAQRAVEDESASEAEQAGALLRHYERAMLVRAQAAALLADT